MKIIDYKFLFKEREMEIITKDSLGNFFRGKVRLISEQEAKEFIKQNN